VNHRLGHALGRTSDFEVLKRPEEIGLQLEEIGHGGSEDKNVAVGKMRNFPIWDADLVLKDILIA
jgi:hypothetical protein